MSRGPLQFKQSDVVRAIKAAKAAGLEIHRTEIGQDGRIVLVHRSDAVAEPDAYEVWKASRASRGET